MKKEYVLIFLLLAGFGIVNTMAFSVTAVSDDLGLYELTGTTGQVTVDAVGLKAIGKNTVYVKIDLSNSGSAADAFFHIILENEAGSNIDLNTGVTAITWARKSTTFGALSTAAVGDDTVLVVSLNDVLADDSDYINLKITGTDIVDHATTGLAKVYVNVYLETLPGSDDASAMTEAESSAL